MDKISPERRSWNMSQIRCKNTSPERKVRSLLHRMGYRFSLNRQELPGKPDIVLSKYKTVVFVHGCFWHRHKGCKESTMPKSRTDFWKQKFKDNVKRDIIAQRQLRRAGWQVLIVWQCQVERSPQSVANRLSNRLSHIRLQYLQSKKTEETIRES